MGEKTMVSLQMTIQEKEALRTCANKEKRSLSNFILLSALERCQTLHDVIPMYDDEDCLQEG